MSEITLTKTKATELGLLLSQTIKSVVNAQETMDAYTLKQKQAYDQAEDGELVIPPTWYHFRNVMLEMELSAQVSTIEQQPHLICQTLEPSMVSLYGYTASSGMKVRVEIEPAGIVPIKETTD